MKRIIVLEIIIVLISVTLINTHSADPDKSNTNRMTDVLSVTFNIPGNPPQSETIIAGIWHHVNVSTNYTPKEELKLIIYCGESIPNRKNITNYYQWVHNGTWSGFYNNTYINVSQCYVDDFVYIFYVGVDAIAPIYKKESLWNLRVKIDGKIVYEGGVQIDSPMIAMGSDTGIHHFEFEPFISQNVTPDYSNYIGTIVNHGNVPLNYAIKLGEFNESIIITYVDYSINQTIMPHERVRFKLTLISNPLPPQRKIFMGRIFGYPTYVISTPGADELSLNATVIELGICYEIYVHHLNLYLEYFGYNTFQYRPNMVVNYSDIATLSTYFCGCNNTKMTINAENVKFLGFDEIQGEINQNSITFALTNTSETLVKFKIKATEPNTKGYIYYTIENLDSGEKYSFTTEINITGSPSPTPHKKRIFIPTFDLVIFYIAIVIVTIVMRRKR
jgi:hypothetical protein